MPERPNRILEFLTAPPQPDGEASRTNRRRPVACPIELSWVEGGRWINNRAQLFDISRGGAGIRANQSPPLTTRARLRIAEGEGSPWVEVKILEVVEENHDQYRIRVRFDGRCPGFILRLAVLKGVEADENPPPGFPYSWSKSIGQRKDY